MSARLTARKVAAAITDCQGFLSLAARRLGCSRTTIYSWRDRSPLVANAIIEARELMGDEAELALKKKIQEGEGWAVCFYLKTQCKERGYVERQEITGADGGAVEVVWRDELIEAPEDETTEPDPEP